MKIFLMYPVRVLDIGGTFRSKNLIICNGYVIFEMCSYEGSIALRCYLFSFEEILLPLDVTKRLSSVGFPENLRSLFVLRLL